MALIKCVDCNNEISELASACPYCGCPIDYSTTKAIGVVEEAQPVKHEEVKETPPKKKKTWLWILIGVIACLGIGCFLFYAIFDFDLHNIECELFGCSEPYVNEHEGEFILITTDYINIRSEHDAGSNNYGTVIKGEYYKVLATFNGNSYYWVQICYDGTNVGWVANPHSDSSYYKFVPASEVPNIV